MKHRIFFKRSLGVGFSILAIAGLPTLRSAELAAGPSGPNDQPALADNLNAEQAEPAPDTDAPVKLVSPERALPANIKPTSPVNEVIKLANSGLTESVMLAYVTNSIHTFNLGAEEIIYLNDIGVPGSVVTAMIQRDEVLKNSLGSGPAQMPPVPEPNLAVGEQAPGPNAGPPEGGEPYAVEAPLTPPDEASGEMFYDPLSPYGSWVDVQGYGRCWQPTVVAINPGWQPYFDCGHWVYSDCGWYWLSDYSWGWAPFHYGSWFRHARMGWCWQPGRVWGPSWVSWRYNDRYCGWAPLPPGAHFVAGRGLTFHGHGVGDREDFGLRPGHYHFVDWNHFNDRHLRPGALGRHEVARVFNESSVATRITGDGHTVINNGLPPSRVAAATHRPIHTVALRETSQAANNGGRAERFEGGGQSLAIYRPRPDSVTRPATRQPSAVSVGTAHAGSSQLTPGSATPWMHREGSTEQSSTVRPGAPLILRGSQSSGYRESPPHNSLVVIGRGNSARPSASAPSQALSPTAAPARPAGSAASALPAPSAPSVSEARVPERRPSADARNWMGTVSRSPQPSWFGAESGHSSVEPRPASPGLRPETPTYRPVPRATTPEVPRYSPAPSFTPQRSFTAPAASAPARAPSYQAPSVQSRPAPSAPSAPAAPARSSSGSDSRSGNRR